MVVTPSGTANSISFKVSAENAEGSDLYFAEYNENGKLIQIIKRDAECAEFVMQKTEALKRFKCFIRDQTEMPLRNLMNIKLVVNKKF